MSIRRIVYSLLFGLSLSLTSVQSASAVIRVVSDIDDTAKISNVPNKFSLIINSMFSKDSFVGMKELYTSFSLERGYTFHYLTGAHGYYRAKVRDFLSSNGFPDGEIQTRRLFKDVYVYKLEYLKELLKKFPNDQFILVGDDTEKDVEVYDEFYRFAPDRVLAIYIRKIVNRPLPPSVYSFLTSYDVARTEYLMGRFNVWEAAPVAMTVLSEKKDRLIVPKFAYCPAKRVFRFNDPKVEEWNERISIRVQKICKSRKLPDEIL